MPMITIQSTAALLKWPIDPSEVEKPPVKAKEYWLNTDLTLDKILDSFAPPETMSFWELINFVASPFAFAFAFAFQT